MGDWAAAYRERVQALAARLDGPDAPQQREALRGELIALGKSLERDLAELTTLKEEGGGNYQRTSQDDANFKYESGKDYLFTATSAGGSS